MQQETRVGVFQRHSSVLDDDGERGSRSEVPDPGVSIAAKLCFLGCNGGAVRLIVLRTGRSDLAAGLGIGGVLVLPGFRGFWSAPGSRGVGGGVSSL